MYKIWRNTGIWGNEEFLKYINGELKEQYLSETGKLILNLDEKRYGRYINIIYSTPEYRNIIKSIPNNLSKLEKAYYVYVRLCEILYENQAVVYNYLENFDFCFDTVRENNVGNCRQMSELFACFLIHEKIVDNCFLTRKPVPVQGLDLRHIDVVLQIDGKLYMADLIRDTVNIRAGIRTMKFGFQESRNSRIIELKEILHVSKLSDEEYKNLIYIIRLVEQSNYKEALEYLNNIPISDTYKKLLKNKIPKVQYITEIEETIGRLDSIPIKSSNPEEVSIEELDKRVGLVRKYKDLKFPFNMNLSKYSYLEDIIIGELIPNLLKKDSALRVNWSYSNNRIIGNDFDDNLEMDIDIILDFFKRVSPRIDPELCLKYINEILNEVYKVRYKDLDFNVKKWLKDNLRVYRNVEIQKIQHFKYNTDLETILVVRKLNRESTKEKYIFYKFDNNNEQYIKSSYKDFIEQIRNKQYIICSKFETKRKPLIEELEL